MMADEPLTVLYTFTEIVVGAGVQAIFVTIHINTIIKFKSKIKNNTKYFR